MLKYLIIPIKAINFATKVYTNAFSKMSLDIVYARKMENYLTTLIEGVGPP
jgi:hypothetical protein